LALHKHRDRRKCANPESGTKLEKRAAWPSVTGGNETQGSEEIIMFNIDFRQAITAAFGALLLTTVSIGAAAGPARVAETTPISVAQSIAPVADQANV
jgi:hypothetical protein